MEFLKIWEILIRRKWIFAAVFLTIFITTVIGTFIITSTYKATAKILIKTTYSPTSILSALGTKDTAVTTATTDEYDTDIELAKIRPLLEELIQSLNLKDRRGKTIKSYKLADIGLMDKVINKIFPQPYLVVNQYKDADMLEIVSYSPDPYDVAAMSNKLSEIYINDRLKRMREEYRSARIFIEDQIQRVKEEYYNSLNAIKDFKLKENTVDIETETKNLIEKISTLYTNYEDNEKLIIESEEKLSKSAERIKEVEKLRKESESYGTSDRLNTLKSKLNEALINLSDKSIDYTKEHPEYKRLEKQIDAIREMTKIEAEIAFNNETRGIDPVYDQLYRNLTESYIDKEVSIAKRRLIQKFIDNYHYQVTKIPSKNVSYSKLELALSVNKDMYQNLLEYLTQISIAESMTVSDIKLVEPAAVPDRRYFPRKSLNYTLAFFFGIFLGLVGALFIEYIDNTVKTSDDIKHIKFSTFLGNIPYSKQLKKDGTISKMDPVSPIVEAFRTIKNRIKYASLDKPIKTIVVTSSRDNEGKSTLVANTAITFGMEGKRVVVVDLNLRRPAQHKLFEVSNQSGITNIFVEGKRVEEAIIHTKAKQVDLLTSGPIPPDPSAIIESGKMNDLIQSLKQTYDIIIIDTPPATVNDAIVIGRFVDRALLVIEYGRATFSDVKHVKEVFDKAGTNIIGVVLNKFKVHRTSYNSYGL
jgi:capsular exopolysaccharide synthesis family protein